MIIDWTSGTKAQLQGYFGLGYIDNIQMAHVASDFEEIISLDSHVSSSISFGSGISRSLSLESDLTPDGGLESGL